MHMICCKGRRVEVTNSVYMFLINEVMTTKVVYPIKKNAEWKKVSKLSLMVVGKSRGVG